MKIGGGIARVAVLALALAGGGCARGASDRGVRGSGTIEVDEIDVSSLVGGRVVALRVDEGDSVNSGDTLAVLERGELVAAVEAQLAGATRARALLADQEAGARAEELRAAQSELEATESARILAEREFDRTQKLLEDRAATQADLDRARTTRDSARARRDGAAERLALLKAGTRAGQLAAARAGARVAEAETRAARSRSNELVLTAPVRGVVLLRNALRGEVVGPGVPVVTLGDPQRLWIRVYVPAPDLPRVRLGAPAEVRVSGSSRHFAGHVVEISTRAEFTPRAALTEDERANLVFGVKIRIDPSDGILHPGLPADVSIESGATPGAARP